MDKFEVSVVIPVYNAVPYVRQAVESALAQSQVREVLMVEDGSPDNALEVCRELAAEYPRVVLLRHPNGENRGAGASRTSAFWRSSISTVTSGSSTSFSGVFVIVSRIACRRGASTPSCST